MMHKLFRPFNALMVLALVSASFLFPQGAQAQSQGWVPVNGPVLAGGDISDLVQSKSDPEIFYLIKEGFSLLRSSDRGNSWSKVHQFVNFEENLVVDPENPEVLYVSNRDGIQSSRDSGSSWAYFTIPGEFTSVPFVMAAPAAESLDAIVSMAPKPTFCQEHEFVFEWTANGGADWHSHDLGCFDGIFQVIRAPSQANTIYVSANLGFNNNLNVLVKSIDGGQTWQTYPLPRYTNCPLLGELLVDPLNAQHVFSTVDGHFIFSLDGGQNWTVNTNFTMGDNRTSDCALHLAASGRDLYAILNGRLPVPAYHSPDGGVTWFQSNVPLPMGAFTLIADANQPGRAVAGLNGFGVYRTEDFGASWMEANQGVQSQARIVALAVAPSDPSIIYAASAYPHNALFESKDGGQTWSLPLFDTHLFIQSIQPVNKAIGISFIAIHPTNPNVVWAGGDGLYETDDGTNWYCVYSNFIGQLKVSPGSGGQPYAALRDKTIPTNFLAHQVNGSFWQANLFGSNFPDVFAIDPFHQGRLLVNTFGYNPYNQSHIYSTDDYGATYHPFATVSPELFVKNLEFSPKNNNNIFAIGGLSLSSVGSSISRDGGKTWADWSEVLELQSVDWTVPNYTNLVIDSKETAYAVLPYEVYRRSLNDLAWTSLGFWKPGIQAPVIQAIALYDGHSRFLVVASERGLFKLNLDPYSTWLPWVNRSE